MSRTYRKIKGRNALQKRHERHDHYLQIEDEEHTKLHGEYHDGWYHDGKFIPNKKPYYSIGWGARKFVKLEGKALKKEKAKEHKDGGFTYGIGKHYKNQKWRQYRRYYQEAIFKWTYDNEYEIIELGNPDSSWDAW